jgi:hypothetical protein
MQHLKCRDNVVHLLPLSAAHLPSIRRNGVTASGKITNENLVIDILPKNTIRKPLN